MILIKKARKKDKPLLIDFKLLTINPYLNNKNEIFKIINYVNNFMNNNYDKSMLIYWNFKLVGAYMIVDDVLDMLFIKEEYRNMGIGTKVVNKVLNNFNKLWIMKNNIKAFNFYKKLGFIIKEEEKDRYLLIRS